MRTGAHERVVLTAVFPLTSGEGAACLQLQDEAELRRGGVYLLARDDAELPALAPRFDELFADAAVKLRDAPALHAPLWALLERARDAARATRPRLEPAALEQLVGVARDAAALEGEHPDLPGAFTLEALVVACSLIFVSEEARYPRPRYKGCDLTLERIREVLPRNA